MKSYCAMQVEVGPEPPECIRLVPLGTVELWDGRPPIPVGADDLSRLYEDWAGRRIDLVVDYEHQTLGGGQAPAAGWVTDMELRADGLWGRVKWTPKASEYIRSREYRYLSPVLELDGERRPLSLWHMGLVNVPAIAGQLPLVAKGLTITAKDGGRDARPTENLSKEAGKAMLKRMKTMFKAEEGAGEDQILALAGKHQEAFLVVTELAEALGLDQGASMSQIKGAALALKQGQDRLGAVEQELAAMKTDLRQRQVAQAVEGALSAGKVSPAQKEWSEAYAAKDLEGFQTFVAQAPVILPLDKLPRTPEGGGGLTAQETEIARQLGVTQEAFKATKDKLAKKGHEGGK